MPETPELPDDVEDTDEPVPMNRAERRAAKKKKRRQRGAGHVPTEPPNGGVAPQPMATQTKRDYSHRRS